MRLRGLPPQEECQPEDLYWALSAHPPSRLASTGQQEALGMPRRPRLEPPQWQYLFQGLSRTKYTALLWRTSFCKKASRQHPVACS
jgi:hypothetical protein